MIIQEVYVDKDGVKHEDLIRTYSNAKKVIKQLETGVEYNEAIDIVPVRYTYTETDKDIVEIEEVEEEPELELEQEVEEGDEPILESGVE